MEKFRLTPGFIAKYKGQKPPFGFGGLGELVNQRTYSRIKSDGTNEDWTDTCQRVVEGCYNMQKVHIESLNLGWDNNKAQRSAQEMFDRMWTMKFLPPGRGLWAMGSAITEERGCFAALNNPLHENTLLLTKEYGWISLREVEGQAVTVLSNTKLYGRDNANAANAVWASAQVSHAEMHPCVEITYQTKSGDSYTIIASHNHRWIRKLNPRDKWTRVTTLDLKVGDWLPKTNHQEIYKTCPKINNDWLKITNLKPLDGLHRVLCATVPDYEQFVIEGGCLTSNCAFVSTKDISTDFAKSFCFLMDASMLGVGVGFDTLGAGLITLKQPKDAVEMVVIPDSREGWVDSVGRLLTSYAKGSPRVEFDYSEIRPAGLPIKGFGGVASGPEPLAALHEEIRSLLDRFIGKRVSKRAIVDIMNMIGKCVVAGNVRRTAEMAMDFDMDIEYLTLKDYDKNPDRMAHGWASNNSVNVQVGEDYSLAAQFTAKNGEPGYQWLENAQAYSRMNNGPDNKDHRAAGVNPCGEQTLESYELCCLVETFPYRCENLADYQRTLKFAYLYAKTVTLGQTHWPETNRILLRNRRIGCSMSGLAQFITVKGINTLREWCEQGYKTLQYYDEVYSEWMCIPRSVKVTSIKPSGTVSLLAGATPGMHYPESRWYIRRMRLAKSSPLVAPLVEAGYKVEDCVGQEGSTVVVEVPVQIEEDIRTVKQVTMWEQLELAAFLQRYWADNQVSVTVTFDPETEGPQIANALNYYQYRLKGVSFLPRLPKGAFPQMPYEEITQEQYQAMAAGLKPLDFSKVNENRAEVERFCDSASCTL